ncbi:MAG: flagellar hook-length control protein FliK [Gallionellaceae bacterium]|nr:flagellar hook-length control protein FliK [Gallionellaceae bacterium]
MNNLPVLTSAPQANLQAANTKPTQAATPTPTAKPSAMAKPTDAPAKAAASEESGTQSQPFGDVLAKQVANNAQEEGPAKPKKISAKETDEVSDKIKAELVPAEIVAADAAKLPAEMLAVLMPQGVANQLSTGVAPKDSGKASDAVLSDKTVLTKSADPATGLSKADPNVIQAGAPQRSNAVTHEALANPKKDAAFTAMLQTMTASASDPAGTREIKQDLIVLPQNDNTALAALQTTLSQTPTNPAAAVQVTINTPVTQPKWGEEFNEKVTWLANKNEQSAELHLNPPELGPMDVVLKVSGDQATAFFTSPHAAVREAIEQALPKLREMMAESGIMLGNATVNDQATRNQQDSAPSKSGNSRSGTHSANESSAASSQSMRSSPIRRHNGIVDTFA